MRDQLISLPAFTTDLVRAGNHSWRAWGFPGEKSQDPVFLQRRYKNKLRALVCHIFESKIVYVLIFYEKKILSEVSV